MKTAKEKQDEFERLGGDLLMYDNAVGNHRPLPPEEDQPVIGSGNQDASAERADSTRRSAAK